MNKITNKEYFEITNCTPDILFPNFDIQEVQDFLIHIGYDILIQEAVATIHEVESDMGGSMERTGRTTQEKRKRILAIKDGDVLPDRIDSEETQALDMRNVFRREVKKKILFG